MQKASYSYWSRGEPNDAYGDEDCVHLLYTYKWNDLYCERNISYICQKPQG